MSLKAVQLLQHFEHLVGPLSRAVQLIAHEFKAHNFVADIIRFRGGRDGGREEGRKREFNMLTANC